MAQHIEHFLHGLLKNDTLWQYSLISQWSTIMGGLKDHVSLEKVQGNMLILGVNNSSWMHELHMLSDSLCERINHHLQGSHIEKIRFVFMDHKKVVYKKKGGVQSKALERAPLTLRQERALQRIAKQDKDLSDYLETYLYKCIANGKQ